MTLWFALALMTTAAIFAVLWPLGQRGAVAGGTDVEVYRDQLDEIGRDRTAGLIGEAEAEAARIEVSRRLIAAAAAAPAAPAPGMTLRRRITALAALILLPLGAGAIYLASGSPHLPGQPHLARMQAPAEQRPIDELVARVEAHLEQNPDDGRGWEVLAPVYMRLGRTDDAVKARRNALRLAGESAPRLSDLGEALAAAANGIVTADAKAAFERARGLDPADFKARYFLGLAAEQDGRPAEAAGLWRPLLADAPADAAWRELVEESLLRVTPVVSGPAPGPSAEDVSAAAGLAPEQREAFVRGMVQRLAERLGQDGSDLDGWLRLVRAYMVLGDHDKARAAAADARKSLADAPDKRKRIDDLVKTLGLET